MNVLSLDLFTHPGIDYEVRQYKILDGIKTVYEKYKRNRLYPHLAEIIDLYQSLQEIKNNILRMDATLPKRIKDLDLHNGKVTYELIHGDDRFLKTVREIIEWSLPLIKQAIDEGVTIYEFVDENIEIEQVGIVPTYIEEGYIFVPDNSEKKLQLFRYEMSIYHTKNDRFRSLKTRYLRSIDESHLKSSLHSIKLDLINENTDLPNPATYSFHTELDFHFEETIFPVAKRKFMQHMAS